MNSSSFALSEPQLRSLVEATLDVITVLSAEGTITYESPSVESVLGYAPEELIGKNAFDFVHVDDAARVGERFVTTLQNSATGEVGTMRTPIEFRFKHKDGSWRHLEAFGRQTHDQALNGIVVISRDVSQRHRDADALHLSNQRLHDFLSNVPVIMWAADATGVLTFSEGKALSELGLSPGEAVGKSLFDLYAGAPALLDACRRALAGEEISEVIELGTLTLESRFSPIRSTQGQITGITGVATDITLRRETEEALLRSEEKFKTAFEQSSTGMALVAPDGRWMQVNAQMSVMTGYSQEELTSTSFQKLTHPNDLDVELNLVERTLSGELVSYQLEKRYRHKEGHYVWVLRNLTLVRGEGNEPLYFISQVQDISERRAAQDALEASQIRQQAILRSALDAIISINAAGAVIEWNPAAERIFGFSRGEALGRDMADLFIPPGMRAAHRKGIAHFLETGSGPILNKRLELPAVRSDGSELVVELVAVQIPVGDEIIFTGFVRDITEWKRASSRLEESEQRYKSLFLHNADAVISLDLAGNFLSANPAMEAITGYSEAEIVGSAFAPFLSVSDRAPALDYFRTVAEGTALTIELGFLHKEGHSVALLVTGIPIVVDNNVVGVYILARDITERLRTEERLRLLESVAVNARDAILITEAEPINEPGPRILYVNESFTRSTGYSLDEVVGKSPRFLQGPATDRAACDKVRIALENLQPVVVELQNYRKNGEPLWVELSIVPVADDRGLITHWVALQRDISQRKESEAALTLAKEEAERANSAKSEFLSRMSHELRTPLNGILGLAQVLQMDRLNEEHREIVDDMYRAGRHLLGLINEVLDISRVESGALSVSLEPVSLADVTEETFDIVAPLAKQRGITLRSDTESLIDRYVMADRQRLVQTFLNLLSNAVKYNRDGGTIDLYCDQVEGGRLRVCVVDTGYGIAPEKLSRLFVPFDRLGADSTEVEGSGLGLTLTKRLVEAMGGSIEVVSSPEVGSSFCFTLPEAHSPGTFVRARSGSHHEPHRAVKSHRFEILHVEDNVLNQKVIEMALRKRGDVALTTVGRADQGLTHAFAHAPDIILLDLHLPDLDGEEVLRQLRCSHVTSAVPIVVLSADATPGRIQRVLASGANGYLTKPIDIDELAAILEKHLLAVKP